MARKEGPSEFKDFDDRMERLRAAEDTLRTTVDDLQSSNRAMSADQVEVFEAYRMFAHDKGWVRRLEEAIRNGLTAEAAVELIEIVPVDCSRHNYPRRSAT